MNIVKENINFKRGKDSKDALDVGMTLERSHGDIIRRLKEVGFTTHSLPFNKDHFYISFSGGHYSIHFVQLPGDEKEWVFKPASTNDPLYKTDNYKDLMEFVFEYFNDRAGLDIFEMNKKIEEMEDYRIKLEKAIESLNQ